MSFALTLIGLCAIIFSMVAYKVYGDTWGYQCSPGDLREQRVLRNARHWCYALSVITEIAGILLFIIGTRGEL